MHLQNQSQMKKTTEITDTKILETFFRKNTALNIYAIGDLDEFFREYTDFYALTDDEEIRQVVFIYRGVELPVLHGICEEESEEEMKELLSDIISILPAKFYSHLSSGIEDVFKKNYLPESRGKYYKMTLLKKNFRQIPPDNNEIIRRITAADYGSLNEFYDSAFPENWKDERMYETGKYFGYFEGENIKGVAGIHVYSPLFRVAALGNITTDPEIRGRSVCKKVTSALCSDLFETVDIIGLNVHTGNEPAIRCYRSLGFEISGIFEEFMIQKK